MSYKEDLARRGLTRLAAKHQAVKPKPQPANVTITGHAWEIIGRTMDRAGIDAMPVHARIVEPGRLYLNSQMEVQRLNEENEQLNVDRGYGHE